MSHQTSAEHWQAAKVVAQLKTPIITNSDLALDALLAFAVFEETGLTGEEAHAQVPIVRHNLAGIEIPVASGIQFEGRIKHARTMIGRALRRNEQSQESFGPKPGTRGGDPWGVDEGRGPYCRLLNTMNTRHTDEVFWLVHGDINWICQRLSRLHTIGARRNQGYGQLGELRIEPIGSEDPRAILVNAASQRPTRNMPLEAWLALGGESHNQRIDRIAYKHPAWREDSLALCALADAANTY